MVNEPVHEIFFIKKKKHFPAVARAEQRAGE
jgi:hypothetical protein